MNDIKQLADSIPALSKRLQKETKIAVKTINAYDHYQKKKFMLELQKSLSETEGISFSEAATKKHAFLNYITKKLTEKENPSIEIMSKFISIFNQVHKKL